VELFLEGGIRSHEMGSLVTGRRDDNGVEHSGPMELLRLAIPRRVYTQSHLDYVIASILALWHRREHIRGLELTYQAPRLRHFTAQFRRVVPAPNG
jgi:tryptophanase